MLCHEFLVTTVSVVDIASLRVSVLSLYAGVNGICGELFFVDIMIMLLLTRYTSFLAYNVA